MKFDPELVYKNIIYLRKRKDFTQDEVASFVGGMSRSNYAKLERGKVLLSYDRLVKFAELFGVTLDQLVLFPCESPPYPHETVSQIDAEEAPPPVQKIMRKSLTLNLTIEYSESNEADVLRMVRELMRLSR